MDIAKPLGDPKGDSCCGNGQWQKSNCLHHSVSPSYWYRWKPDWLCLWTKKEAMVAGARKCAGKIIWLMVIGYEVIGAKGLP